MLVGARRGKGGRQAAQRGPPHRQGKGRSHALQARAAQLRRLRREAGVHARPVARPDGFPRRAPRPADLRGRLVPRGHRVPIRAGAELLLVPNGSPFEMDEVGGAHGHRRRARRRERAADGLRQPGRRTGRAGVRRRLVRAERGRGVAVQMPAWHESIAVTNGRAAGGWRCERRHDVRRRGARPPTRRWCWACATTCTRTASRASSSACPAASTPRWLPPWPSTRSVPTRARVMLPYRYTTGESLEDADACAKALGVPYQTLSIEAAVTGSAERSSRRSGHPAPTSPRRTSSRACAASP